MAIIDSQDVIQRYPKVSDISSAGGIDIAWVNPAINELESRLSSQFTVPFSDNNMTAKDLAIDLTYCRIQMSRNSDISESVCKRVDERIKDLLEGKTFMVTSGGTSLERSTQLAWSTTQDYNPVFGMGDIIDSVVDSNQVYDEEQAKL